MVCASADEDAAWRGIDLNGYFDGLRRYFSFWGRSTRKQFWYFILVCTILVVAAWWFDSHLNLQDQGEELQPALGLILVIHLIPALTVFVRRLHDIDRRGWWVLLSFFPLFGLVFMTINGLTPSTAGPNRFGPPVAKREKVPVAANETVITATAPNFEMNIEKLERLASLRASGAIDEEEFLAMKTKLIGGAS